MLCYKYRSSLFDLNPKPYSYYKYFVREYHFHFLGLGFRVGSCGFFYGGVRVYGFEVVFFLCGGVWFFWWFHYVGLRLGFFGELGLR